MRYGKNWICTTPLCSAEQWLVQAMPRQHDVWRIATGAYGRSRTVAAPQPICPLCGADLSPSSVIATTLGTAEYDVVLPS